MNNNTFEVNIANQKKAFSYGYVILFLLFYTLIPIFYVEGVKDFGINTLAITSIISIVGFLVALNFDFGKSIKRKKIVIDFKSFASFIFVLYVAVITVIFLTAGQIPLLASLKGASQDDLFGLREGFLKRREGWEASLAYIVTIIDSAIFPYLIIYAYNVKYKLRHIFLAAFILYSFSFLEKAYFFKIALPLFVYFYFLSKRKKRYLMMSGGFIFGLVFLMFLFSKFDNSEVVRDDPFFSILHTPQGVGEALLWRSVAVPVITASQGMELFYTNFKGENMYGATSSLLSSVFGLERTNFERDLYQSQFGGQETGNANQCYLVEAFINYGYFGVFLFSLLTGALVKGVIRTKDVAALCIMPLFIYNLFNSGLIGNLLSNGFLLFFLMMRFVKIK